MIEFATFKLNWKPNQFLVAPPGLCENAQPHVESTMFNCSPEELLERFRKVALSEPRTREVADHPTQTQTVFVQKSRVFRFPDVIDVMAVPSGDGQSALAIYSRAQIGVRDFGVNRKRIESWLSRLEL